MLLLTQTANGAISGQHSSLLPFTAPNPRLFSNSRPRFPSSNPNPRHHHPPKLSISSRPASSSPLAATNQDEVTSVADDDVTVEGVIQFEKPPSEDSSKFFKSVQVGLLAGGDILCLLVFSAVGRFSHGLPVLDWETLRTADPFVAGWVLSAYFLGAYGDDGRGVNGYSRAVVAAVKSWALGIPLGLGIRAFTLGHIPQTTFILITMGATGVLLIAWRALVTKLLPTAQNKQNDDYKRGSPFELFELLTSLVRRW